MSISNFTSLFLFSYFCLMLLVSAPNLIYSQETEIKPPVVRQIKNGIYVHKSAGANLTICSGSDGLLLIDTGSKKMASKSDSLIRSGFNKPIKLIINTHFHFDHVQGNRIFSKDGAIVAASSNTRLEMMKEWKAPEIPGVKFPLIPAFSEDYLPDICFNDSIQIHLNDEDIKLIHFPGGHSSGDVVVFFEKANVIHMGDLFITDAFPPVSDISTYIEVLEKIIERCDDNTIVIPGHGNISGVQELVSYKELLANGSERILKLKSQGHSYEDILEMKPLVGLLNKDSWIPEPLFIYCIYFKPKI